MAVQVTRAPDGQRGWPVELCCKCRTKTRYWYGTGALNVALCPACASISTSADIPTKAEWFRQEREHASLLAI